jgi:NAD-dependent deacetylase
MPTSKILSAPETNCWMAEVEGRRYWEIMSRSESSIHVEAIRSTLACPFRHGLYQMMRNRVLADELVRRSGAEWADFAVCLHPGNQAVVTLDEPVSSTRNVIDAFRSLSSDQAVLKWNAKELLATIRSTDKGLEDWESWMCARYFANEEIEKAQPAGQGRSATALPQKAAAPAGDTRSLMFQIPHDLRDRLQTARRVLILTGAGVSAESGIPTFRDAMIGLWERFDAEQLATLEAFREDPDLVWGWYEWRRAKSLRAEPNAAHQAIAQWGVRSPGLVVVTQNVDDLHERAGSLNVIHLHGSLHSPRCVECGRKHVLPEGVPDEPEGGRRLDPPLCAHCSSLVRPGVVWFGEGLPPSAWNEAQKAAESCDLMICAGTSALVYPAALAKRATRLGDPGRV